MLNIDTNPAPTATSVQPHVPPHKLPATYQRGRRCVGENRDGTRCITRLSTFNPGPCCYVHAAQHLAAIAALN